MKNVFFERAYQLFLLIGFISLGVALFFKSTFPDTFFDVSIYDIDISMATSRIWFLFTGYLFLLAFIYFVIGKTKLKTKKWLVISHYTFIVLFLVFFALFSSFGNPSVQRLFTRVPLITLISLYGIVFLIDTVFFILGVLLLFINLFSLNKDKDE